MTRLTVCPLRWPPSICRQSRWNIFDFVVVFVGLISLMPFGDIPGVSVLRLLRAFRVFRLFKRLKSLRIILTALEEAIPGCMNAFVILLLVQVPHTLQRC